MKNKNEIKIIHLVCTFFPQKEGFGNVALKQAQIGSQKGYNVSIYTPNYQKMPDFETFDNSIGIYRIKPYFHYGRAGFINIKKHIKKADILHIHYPFYFSTAIAIKQAKKYKKKIVISWHMNARAFGIKNIYFKLHEKFILPWIIKNADTVLVSTKDYFLNHGFEYLFNKYKNKIEELPFSVDIEKFKPEEKNKDLIKKYGLKNKNVLIFVGSLNSSHHYKGLNILFDAFSKLDQNKYKLFIIGSGNTREAHIKYCESLKINKNVIFLGAINNKNLITYYNLSDVLVLPSTDQNEAFGIVQIEAMACAKPVIVSDLPGVRTVVDNGKTGFTFQTKNSNDLKNKIEKIFEDPKKYKLMCANARNRVVEKFIDAVVFQKLNKIYENLFDK